MFFLYIGLVFLLCTTDNIYLSDFNYNFTSKFYKEFNKRCSEIIIKICFLFNLMTDSRLIKSCVLSFRT